MRLARSMGLLVVTTALAAGCAGDEPSGGGTPRPDGPHQGSAYERRGNALCAAQLRVLRQVPPPPTAKGLGDHLEKLSAVERRFDPLFRALEPPPELKRLHRRLIVVSDRHRPVLRRLTDRVKESRTPALTLQRQLPRLAELAEKELSIVRKLGLTKCLELGAADQATSQGAY